MGGIGAIDNMAAYDYKLMSEEASSHYITQIEALNVVVALHTLITPTDIGSHIRVWCDNEAAVAAIATGRARDPALMMCARAVWMVQAIYNIRITMQHIPGKQNTEADVLSRAHISQDHRARADSIYERYNVSKLHPCLHAFQPFIDEISPPRSPTQHLVGAGRTKTVECKGVRHMAEYGIGGKTIPPILQPVRGHGPCTSTMANMCIHGALIGRD